MQLSTILNQQLQYKLSHHIYSDSQYSLLVICSYKSAFIPPIYSQIVILRRLAWLRKEMFAFVELTTLLEKTREHTGFVIIQLEIQLHSSSSVTFHKTTKTVSSQNMKNSPSQKWPPKKNSPGHLLRPWNNDTIPNQVIYCEL